MNKVNGITVEVSSIDEILSSIKNSGLSYSAKKKYCYWTTKFFRSYPNNNPLELGRTEIKQYLEEVIKAKSANASKYLAAYNSLKYLYENYLQQSVTLEKSNTVISPLNTPVSLTNKEIGMVIKSLNHPWNLVARIMYSSGLRPNEALSLRIEDINTCERKISVRDKKSNTKRIITFNKNLLEQLQRQINRVVKSHSSKYNKTNSSSIAPIKNEYLFPAISIYNAKSGIMTPQHANEKTFKRHVKMVIQQLNLSSDADHKVFRHSFTTRLLEANVDINKIQQALGHSEPKITQVYAHVLRQRQLDLEVAIT